MEVLAQQIRKYCSYISICDFLVSRDATVLNCSNSRLKAKVADLDNTSIEILSPILLQELS